MISYEKAIQILKDLKDSAKAIENYEDSIFADERGLAESYKNEMIETLLNLDLGDDE